jgi:hypothetical protein
MIRLNALGKTKRTLAVLLPLIFLSQWACSQQEAEPRKPSTPLSAEDAALQHKFRGVHGGELRVDSMFDTHSVVIINADTGYLFNIGTGSFGPSGSSVSSYGGNVKWNRLPLPKHLRMMRYPEDARYLGRDKFSVPRYEGEPIVDVTVPVAARIPQDALDDIRKHGGGLRLKLRIHPETLLVGWDVARMPGYDPKKQTYPGIPDAVETQYSSVGGDFREAKIFNGQVVRLGWYIDKKTGRKIETDF